MEDILNNLSILKNNPINPINNPLSQREKEKEIQQKEIQYNIQNQNQINQMNRTSNFNEISNINILQDFNNPNNTNKLNEMNTLLNQNNNNDSLSLNINNINNSLHNSMINFHNNKTFIKKSGANNLNPINISNQQILNNNKTKLATSIIIDENLPVLNDKLKRANDYYTSRNNMKNEINIDNVSDINIVDRSPKDPMERIKFNEMEVSNKSLHVSGYIKNFINQAHEEKYFDENEDIFKLKNCKIYSKGNN